MKNVRRMINCHHWKIFKSRTVRRAKCKKYGYYSQAKGDVLLNGFCLETNLVYEITIFAGKSAIDLDWHDVSAV